MQRTLLRVAAPALGVAAVLGFLVRFDRFVERAVRGLTGTSAATFPGWLPRLGTVGTTVLGYSLLLELLVFLASPVLVFALGYRFGRRRDVAQAYPVLLAGLTAGGLVGLVVGRLLAVGWLGAMPLDPALRPAPSAAAPELPRLIAFVLAGFAGAALAQFGTSDASPKGRGLAIDRVLAALPVVLFGLQAVFLLVQLAFVVL